MTERGKLYVGDAEALSRDELEYLSVITAVAAANGGKLLYAGELLEEKFIGKIGGYTMKVVRDWVLGGGREPKDTDEQFWSKIALARTMDQLIESREKEEGRRKSSRIR